METRVISGLRPTYGRLGRCPAACTEHRDDAEWRPERQEEGRQNTCGAAATRGWRPLPGSLQCFGWLASWPCPAFALLSALGCPQNTFVPNE